MKIRNMLSPGFVLFVACALALALIDASCDARADTAFLIVGSADAPKHPQAEAPVYQRVGSGRSALRVSTLTYEASKEYSILYCMREPGANTVVQCVVEDADRGALILMDLPATVTGV